SINPQYASAVEVAGALDGRGVLRVDRREREEVVVGQPCLGGEGPEAGDEAGLVQEQAVRWRREDRVTCIGEVGSQNPGRSAVAPGHHLAKILEGGLDPGIGPLRLAGPPAVVVVGAA